MKNVKSISENELIVHRPVHDITGLNFDKTKSRRRRPKNLVQMEATDNIRRSTLSIRLFLKEFCVEFLRIAYNSIMYVVKVGILQIEMHIEKNFVFKIYFLNRISFLGIVLRIMMRPTIYGP